MEFRVLVLMALHNSKYYLCNMKRFTFILSLNQKNQLYDLANLNQPDPEAWKLTIWKESTWNTTGLGVKQSLGLSPTSSTHLLSDPKRTI